MFRWISAIFTRIGNWWTKKGMDQEEAADQDWTKDAKSKARAFDLYAEDLEKEFTEFRSAIEDADGAVQTKRELKDTAEKTKKESEEAFAGALHEYEAAEGRLAAAKQELAAAKDDPARKAAEKKVKQAEKDMADAQKNGTQFEKDVAEWTTKFETLTEELEGEGGAEEKLEELLAQLEEMQKEMANLPTEKATAIAEHIANTKLVDAYDRAMGMRKKANRRPIDAVKEDNKKLAARAKITGKIAGVDADKTRKKYIQAGKTENAQTNFAKQLAARKLQKEQATGGKPVEDKPAQQTDDQGKI